MISCRGCCGGCHMRACRGCCGCGVQAVPRWVMVLPDGSTISFMLRTWSGATMVDVTIQLAIGRSRTMMGLCGTNDGEKNNDLVGATGVTHGCTLLLLLLVLVSGGGERGEIPLCERVRSP
jgi:hypothetical protein